MEKFFGAIDKLSEWMGKLASFLMAGLVAAICYDVFMRYVFSKPTYWAFELTYMVYGAYSMLGVAYCLLLGSHVRMDMLYSKLSTRRKAWMDVIGYILLFFPFMIVLTYKCGDHTYWTWESGESSSSSVWRPQLWPFKATIMAGFIMLILQGIANFLRSLGVALKGGR
ncbi:MAG: TRAP transporter small permease subunit [Desulfobacteraceae bacterium]|nr:MAG: TRAP transporter small permease subunit [Desulfobacteraceae bacterium]